MALKVYNDFIARATSGYQFSQPIWDEITTATTASVLAGQNLTIQRLGFTANLPNPLPPNVTGYLVTKATATMGTATGVGILFAKLLNFGVITLNAATATYSGSSNNFVTNTELGLTANMATMVVVECITPLPNTLQGTAGNMQIAYIDQNGNAKWSASQAITNASVYKSVGVVNIWGNNDWGVQAVIGAAFSGQANAGGQIQLWGLIPLSMMAASPRGVGSFSAEDLSITSFNPVRLQAGDQIGAFSLGTATVKAMSGNISVIGDN